MRRRRRRPRRARRPMARKARRRRTTRPPSNTACRGEALRGLAAATKTPGPRERARGFFCPATNRSRVESASFARCATSRVPELLVGRRQDRDLRRAGFLGDRHDVDRRAQKDVLVATDQQRLRARLRERLANLGLEIGRVELARPEVELVARVTVSTGSLRRCDTGPAAFAFGSTTFMPARDATSDSTSAVDVTMKMIRRTRKTSVSGVMLISATTLSAPTSPSSLARRSVVDLDVDSHGALRPPASRALGRPAATATTPASASRPGRARSGTPRRTGGSASR